MKLLLDTHILIWWALNTPELPQRYVPILRDAEELGDGYGVSVMTYWEIAKLVSLNKMDIPSSLDTWFEELEGRIFFKSYPVTSKVAVESTRLGANFPKDPADQLIVATARQFQLTLLTCDEGIRKSGVVAVL